MDIRLIVCDLDGTLLDDKKELHPDFWEVFPLLQERNILFAVASGRQIFNIENTFTSILDEIAVIAENGTYVRYKNEDFYLDALDRDIANQLIKTGREVEDAEIVLCCKKSAYIECHKKDFVEEAALYYDHLEIVDDLTEVDDIVLKFAMYDYKEAESNSHQHFTEYNDMELKVTVSGTNWMDVFNLSASKGHAIDKIQEKTGITKEQTMVFGDYLNDLEMMSSGYYSYAMKNAHPEIKKIALEITEFDNNNNGVMKTIRNKLKI